MKFKSLLVGAALGISLVSCASLKVEDYRSITDFIDAAEGSNLDLEVKNFYERIGEALDDTSDYKDEHLAMVLFINGVIAIGNEYRKANDLTWTETIKSIPKGNLAEAFKNHVLAECKNYDMTPEDVMDCIFKREDIFINLISGQVKRDKKVDMKSLVSVVIAKADAMRRSNIVLWILGIGGAVVLLSAICAAVWLLFIRKDNDVANEV